MSNAHALLPVITLQRCARHETRHGPLSHVLTVARDSPEALAIALRESLSRNFTHLPWPVISTVITFLVLAEKFSSSVEQAIDSAR